MRRDEHFNADILILAVTKIHSKPQDFLSDLRRLATVKISLEYKNSAFSAVVGQKIVMSSSVHLKDNM